MNKPTAEDTIRKMNWPKLLEEIKVYDDLCYGPNACFGVRDMVYLDMLNYELFRRQERSEEHGT